MVKSKTRQAVTATKVAAAERVTGPADMAEPSETDMAEPSETDMAEPSETVRRLVKVLRDRGATVEVVVVGHGASPLGKAVTGRPPSKPPPDGDAPMKVGAYTKRLIGEGLDNAAIIKELRKRFPDAANTPGNINWYRRKLRGDG